MHHNLITRRHRAKTRERNITINTSSRTPNIILLLQIKPVHLSTMFNPIDPTPMANPSSMHPEDLVPAHTHQVRTLHRRQVRIMLALDLLLATLPMAMARQLAPLHRILSSTLLTRQ
jgi:hypothetical protein